MWNAYSYTLIAYAAFSGTDASVKAVGGELPVFAIMLLVYSFAAAFLLLTQRYLLILAIVGGFFGLGQWGLVKASRIGPASKIAPLHYTQLVWGTAFGVLLFREYPGGWTVVGLMIIAAPGLLTALREAIRWPKPPQGGEAELRAPC